MLSLRALMLTMALALFASNEDASAKTTAKKSHTFHGTVVHVHHGKDKQHGTITVKHHRGNGDSVTKTFRINESTNIQATGNGKGTGSHLHKGTHVAVRHTGHHADEIKVGQPRKQK